MKIYRKFIQKISRKYLYRSMILPIFVSSFIVSGVMLSAQEGNSKSDPFISSQSIKVALPEIQEIKTISLDTKELREGVKSSELLEEKEISVQEEIKLSETLKTGFTSATVNVRSEASLNSEVVGIFPFNSYIEYMDYNDDWVVIFERGIPQYVYRSYVSGEEIPYTTMKVTGDIRKSFMDYTTITSVSSNQYKIQSSKAYTGESGVRMVNGRYLIAIGSFYSKEVGQYIDLVLENGTVIPCIIGDCKSDKDTMNNHATGKDGSTAEFIIQTSAVSSDVRKSGDCSDIDESWESPVIEVRIYNKNVFD